MGGVSVILSELFEREMEIFPGSVQGPRDHVKKFPLALTSLPRGGGESEGRGPSTDFSQSAKEEWI